MAIYAVGDVQGCYDELSALLEQLRFDTTSDQLWLVGDLVNRGPKSLQTLRLVKDLGAAATCVLGNHDLHLLALALAGDVPVDDGDLGAVLAADDCDELISWLRELPLAHYDAELDTLLVHAGVWHSWSVDDALQLAAEVQQVIRGDSAAEFLAAMYGSKPDRWHPELSGTERLRFITNCLTRIRHCAADGTLEFSEKGAPGSQPESLQPWFELPDRGTAGTRIVFGHWSTLGLMQTDKLLALDTGCVWGDSLTAIRLDNDEPAIAVPSQQPRKFARAD